SVRAKASSTVFFTLVVPLAANDPLPVLRVLTGEATCSQRLSFEVIGVGRNKAAIDRVAWSSGTEYFALGTAMGAARAAWARASAPESESVVHAREVSTIACAPCCATELLSGAGPGGGNKALNLSESGGPKR